MQQALGNSVVCKKSHCDLQSADLLERPLRTTKKWALLMSFKHILHAGQVVIDIPREKVLSPKPRSHDAN